MTRRLPFTPPPDWMTDALCAIPGLDPTAWHDPEHLRTYWGQPCDDGCPACLGAYACARCPVSAECLAHALATEQPHYRHGTYGGLSANQRARLAGDNNTTTRRTA